MNSVPSEVLILRGLTAEITEKMISEYLEKLMYSPECIRVLKDKSTGLSKGIAIVRFKDVKSASHCLECCPRVDIMDSVGWFEFGFEHSDDDWKCNSCKSINFHRRSVCFKCSLPKNDKILEFSNDGRDDISTLPTRFLLLRNLDKSLNSQKIFEAISIYEGNLKRVWLVRDRQSKVSRSFSLLEFSTVLAATQFISRQTNLGLPLKIGSTEILLSFGRDLDLLSQSINGSTLGMITYWDNALEFSEFPVFSVQQPEAGRLNHSNSSLIGLPAKRSIVGSVPNLSRSGPPKKIQLQLKAWSDKANAVSSDHEIHSLCEFVPETEKIKNNDRKKFIDTEFCCCLLCDTTFNSEIELMDHAKNSPTHSQKFDEYLQNSVKTDDETYHDRAAERREAFGESEKEILQKLKTTIVPRDSAQSSAVEPNVPDYSIGEKLLKKMGWKEGSGLGKNSTGIKEPVKAKTVQYSGAGIGASNLVSAEEIEFKSYKEKIKSERNKRFNER